MYDGSLICFNSTMVRLKDRYIMGEKVDVEFQFHYGTIKSISKYNTSSPQQMFQFHYGTIKRSIYRYKASIHSGFNSTMVRLKGFRFPLTVFANCVSIPLWYD